jgi:hypothetical protein
LLDLPLYLVVAKSAINLLVIPSGKTYAWEPGSNSIRLK